MTLGSSLGMTMAAKIAMKATAISNSTSVIAARRERSMESRFPLSAPLELVELLLLVNAGSLGRGSTAQDCVLLLQERTNLFEFSNHFHALVHGIGKGLLSRLGRSAA